MALIIFNISHSFITFSKKTFFQLKITDNNLDINKKTLQQII